MMPSQVFAATANSPSSSAPAHTAHHAGSSASTLSEALARPEGGRFISHVVPEYTVFLACELCRSLRRCSFDVVFQFAAVYHDETRFSCSKVTEAASSGRRSSTPRTTFPRRGIRGADGITIWPTGVLLTVCEHTHPTPQIYFQLDRSRGAGPYNTRHEVQI